MREGAYALALAAKEAGDWNSAYRLASEARVECEGDHEAVGHAALLAGVAAYELGRADDAVRSYQAAAESFSAAGNEERLAAARFNEGLALFRASRLVEAIAAYEVSLGLFETLGDDRHRATCLMNLGNACRHAGKLAEALALYQQARSAFQALGDEDRLGRCFLNAGNVLADLGRLRESTTMFERAREIFRKNGVTQHEAGALINLADLALRDGRPDEAIALSRSARSLFEAARLQRFVAECDLIEGKASRSIEAVRRAIDCYELFGDRRHAAGARMVAADLVPGTTGMDDLTVAAEQLIAFREEFGDPSSAAQASKPLAEVGARLVHALCLAGDVEGAWGWMQRLRERRSGSGQPQAVDARTQHLRAEIEAIDRELASSAEGQDGLRRRREAALAELSAEEFRSTSLKRPQEALGGPGLPEVQSQLEPSAIILEAVAAPEAIHLIAISKGEVRHRHIPVGRLALEEAITHSREAVSRPGGSWAPCPTMEEVGSAIADLSEGYGFVVWCPDGLLEAAAVAPWFLDADTAWMQSASSTYWLSSPATASGRPVAVGICEHHSGLGSLPEARREAESVARILGDCGLLLDDEATVNDVRKAAAYARVVHLATHAVPNESVPLYSRLELAGGSLYGRDLLEWGIGSELVFLSACSTAEGQRSPTGTSIGLAWAMLAGGARVVVASCWPVHDHAAQLWVERFYEEYVLSGNPAASHKAACQDMANSRYRSPHFWANWKVLGSR